MQQQLEQTTKIHIEPKILFTALRLVEKSFHKEGKDNIKNGVNFKFSKDGVVIIATNGNILSQYFIREYRNNTSVAIENPQARSIVVSGKGVENAVKLMKACEKLPEYITIELLQNSIAIYCGEFTHILEEFKFIDPNAKVSFPDTTKFIPQEHPYFAKFNRKDLINLLKSNDSPSVVFKFSDGQMFLPDTEAQFKQVVTIKCFKGTEYADGVQVIQPEE